MVQRMVVDAFQQAPVAPARDLADAAAGLVARQLAFARAQEILDIHGGGLLPGAGLCVDFAFRRGGGGGLSLAGMPASPRLRSQARHTFS
ncbi:hypothetical protein ACHFCA_13900 [Delftia tsuruhatensis]